MSYVLSEAGRRYPNRLPLPAPEPVYVEKAGAKLSGVRGDPQTDRHDLNA